jgi:hypothetical protein
MEAEAPALPPLKPWTGDFDKMKERRLIRIIVPFSKTIYFLDKGMERGTAAEFGRQFEVCINQKYKTKALKIRVAFIPVSHDRLLTGLDEGLGDIAAGNLTITPERLKIVDFSDPGIKNVKEVIVTGPDAPALTNLDDLAGQKIHVRKSSSYWGHLQALNDPLKAKGLKEITPRALRRRPRGRGSPRDGQCRASAFRGRRQRKGARLVEDFPPYSGPRGSRRQHRRRDRLGGAQELAAAARGDQPMRQEIRRGLELRRRGDAQILGQHSHPEECLQQGKPGGVRARHRHLQEIF